MSTSAEFEPRFQPSEISKAINRISHDHHGRGSSASHTIMQGDYVASFFREVYTPLERTLIDAGQEEAVRETRHKFQIVMRDQFIAAVERITGRKVIAFMSEVHFNPDMAVEIFVLAPQPEAAPS